MLLVAAGVYLPARGNPFVYEDDAIGAAPVWSWPGRGLTMWTEQGSDATRAHAGNLLLHLVNGAGVALLATELATPAVGLAAAAVFLWHPMTSEAVLDASARADLLVTFFTLLAILAALHGTAVGWLVAVAATVAAGASKEIGAISPLLLLLTVWCRRPSLLARAPWAATLAGVFGLALGLTGHAILSWLHMDWHTGGSVFGWPTYASLQNLAVWRLLALVWPQGFTIDHDVLALAGDREFAATVLTTVVLGVAVLAARRVPLLTWAIGWVVIAVLPRFVFQTNEFIHEYQLVTADVAVSVLLGVGLVSFLTWRTPEKAIRPWHQQTA